MSKLYKSYSNAVRFNHGAIDAVTVEGVEGFMDRQYIAGSKELAHDTASYGLTTRHLVVVALQSGLFGTYWFDKREDGRPFAWVVQTLFKTSEAAMTEHQRVVGQYRQNPKWA